MSFADLFVSDLCDQFIAIDVATFIKNGLKAGLDLLAAKPIEQSSHAHSISRLSLSTEDAVGFLGGLLVRLDARVAALEGQLKMRKGGQS